MKVYKIICSAVTACLLFSFGSKEKVTTVKVKNVLNKERSLETVTLTKIFLNTNDLKNLGVRDKKTGKLLVTQLVDNDGDGTMDELLFQPVVAAKSTQEFEVLTVSDQEKPKSIDYCYSRFVPERTDDYTWENNKVAFRVYGPVAQKMIEDKVKGGTLSSGVDAWLKRVDYSIINKWYKKVVDKTGSYHEDTGEGLDNFHVGSSRGVGGIAVKGKEGYYFGKNYTEYKTITTGPIRTSFYLNYADWDADGNEIVESKIISLDYGSRMSKFETSLKGTKTIAAGLTLHEKKGKVTGNKKNGWVSYFEPIGDSEIGTAIVATKEYFCDFETYDTPKADLSNAFANLKVKNNKVVYYAGHGWKKQGDIKNVTEWENYLNQFSENINHPLVVSLTK
ncbi:DUF4861 domain-containing protein [Flavobacterium faecale]|uniref:DUF4861 domain-containing protein n=1 Tax=Flavobacterium faecale TaxID=1355330 RepID=A0A2S1LID6_9FLAO|nr:DUF4861 family protein [Flavobacterium faecale]AWG23542.1 DUF4861 domain-containing protein [Flavobacterium faecale]